QDMVLGLYYLTKGKPGAKGEGRAFANIDEVLLALHAGEVETLSPIRLRYTGEVIDLTTAYDDQDIVHTDAVPYDRAFLNTTVGRAILNDHLPPGMPYVNGLLKKKGIGQLVSFCYLKYGLELTVKMLDEVKQLGFNYATRAGLSIGIDDLVIPDNKKTLVRDAEKQVVSVQQQYLDGAITDGERKGLADTALKTADSGYLTRRLVDVAQDVIISEYDCGTVDGIYVAGIVEAGEIIEPLRDRIVGRVSLEKIKDYDGNVIVDINQ